MTMMMRPKAADGVRSWILIGVVVAILSGFACYEEAPPPRYPSDLGDGEERLLPTGSPSYDPRITGGSADIVPLEEAGYADAGYADEGEGEYAEPEPPTDATEAPEDATAEGPGEEPAGEGPAAGEPVSAEVAGEINTLLTRMGETEVQELSRFFVRRQESVVEALGPPLADVAFALLEIEEIYVSDFPKTGEYAASTRKALRWMPGDELTADDLQQLGEGLVEARIGGTSVRFEQVDGSWRVRIPSLPSEDRVTDYSNALRDFNDAINNLIGELETDGLDDTAARQRLEQAHGDFTARTEALAGG